MPKLEYPYGQPPANSDVLWRVEAKRYSVVIDPDREEYGVTDPILEARWWHVRKRTPKGAWIHERFVLLTARKRYACPTIDEAIESFRKRKQRHIRILETQLSRAKAELALLNENKFAPA